MQADAYRKGGKLAEGLAILEDGITLTIEGVESTQQADLYRLKGEMLLEKGASQRPVLNTVEGAKAPEAEQVEAEECFQRAIVIAQRQDAKSLELRAVVSLSRLWQQQHKQDDARRRLAEAYNWFTEGFETTDLQEAKNLLDELQNC
jgi:tetratricopeptide (TPR) repeat protein